MEVFVLTHKYIEELIREVIYVLLEFYFKHDGVPSHGSYTAIRSSYGTMSVGLGPNGFEFSDFHETKESGKAAADASGLG